MGETTQVSLNSNVLTAGVSYNEITIFKSYEKKALFGELLRPQQQL